jgi:NADH:ubiquinone oxidoreductase subunit 5 (subunit L)/multisubunit Na+/H+ antiporter MnhA subunit
VNAFQDILVFVVVAPGIIFAVFGLLWIMGWVPSERLLSRVTGATFASCTSGVAVLVWRIRSAPGITVTFGNWFAVGTYHFPLVLMVDRLSVPFVALAAVLSGLIGQFSATYLHRESGFLRFFLLLHLFAFGSLLAFAAGSFDLLAAGWELVGITSVLLIGFFERRPAPVENGLYVFGIYRASDIGLLVGIFAMHHWAGTASFVSGFPVLTGARAIIVCLLLLLAASGKAAQVPFSGWLPRAMEGPTPSSAIFYGAISIHAGAYLLLRAQPLLAQSVLASFLVILIGAATAIHGTIVGRSSTDAKTSLAYATVTQVGIVFIEIGLGWRWLAVAHILGNATVRTMQYLRAPSMLHDYHQMHSAIGSEFAPTGKQVEEMLPEKFQLWLYRWALDRGHLDTMIERWIVAPLAQISAYLSRRDRTRARSATTIRPAVEVSPVGPARRSH